MKTSLKKLQKFAAIKHDKRSHKQHQSLAQDELARATQDMNDMKDCYDRLLSAAAAAVNSVYEFSESLREMGDCLLEKTALNDDEDSGKVLLMLGKVQFELQRLVDGYRSHIIQTISMPSDSLLNELRIVEEMKKRCDEKREIYEAMLKKQKEKGRLRNSRGECFHLTELEEAHEAYDDEANVFVFRMKSLKQGQSRSFLTQASRHHAAQLYFFKKAVGSLETIEPHVKSLAEQLHIDYQFSELEQDGQDDIYIDDDESDVDDDNEDVCGTLEDRELSFNYGHNVPVQEIHTLNKPQENSNSRNSFSFEKGIRAISRSAPLFPEKKLESSEPMSLLRPSGSRKVPSYVLPTPDVTKSSVSQKLSSTIPRPTQQAPNLWHSSPLDRNKHEKLRANENSSGPVSHSVLKERNIPKASPLPPPYGSHAKKAKRLAFSGPLTGKPRPNNGNFTASGPIASSAFTSTFYGFSGSLLHPNLPRPSSNPKLSSPLSVTMSSAPRISELHELPRPPAHLPTREPSHRDVHSSPLVLKSHEMSTAIVPMSTAASTLPIPPQVLPRCYSNPSGRPTEAAASRLSLESSHNSEMVVDITSPPLTPVPLPNV